MKNSKLSQTQKIAEIWTRGIENKDAKEKFVQALVHDTLVLGRLDEILDTMLDELARSEGTHADYDSPSWAYKTADRIGRRRSLMAVKELIAPAVAKLK
jgi:hypothetical protein